MTDWSAVKFQSCIFHRRNFDGPLFSSSAFVELVHSTNQSFVHLSIHPFLFYSFIYAFIYVDKLPELPPAVIVVVWRDVTAKHVEAPSVECQRER